MQLYDGGGRAWSPRALAGRVHAHQLDDKDFAGYAIRNLGVAALAWRGEVPHIRYRADYVERDAAGAVSVVVGKVEPDRVLLQAWGGEAAIMPWRGAVSRLMSGIRVPKPAAGQRAEAVIGDAGQSLIRELVNSDADYPLDSGGVVYRRSRWGLDDTGESWVERVGRGFNDGSREALERRRGRFLSLWSDQLYAAPIGCGLRRAVSKGVPIVHECSADPRLQGVERALRLYRRLFVYCGFMRGRHEVRMLTATLAEQKAA